MWDCISGGHSQKWKFAPVGASCSAVSGYAITSPSIKFYPGHFDPSSCCSLCHDSANGDGASQPKCVAYSLNASGCALKASTVGLVPSSNSNAGLSQPLPTPNPSPTPPHPVPNASACCSWDGCGACGPVGDFCGSNETVCVSCQVSCVNSTHSV